MSLPSTVFTSASILGIFGYSTATTFETDVTRTRLTSRPATQGSGQLPIGTGNRMQLQSMLSVDDSKVQTVSDFVPYLPTDVESSNSLFSEYSEAFSGYIPEGLRVVTKNTSLTPGQ